MIENAKIQFSAEELELLRNTEWILTKNRVIEKMALGLSQLASRIQNEIKNFYPFVNTLTYAGFKVSRGERYQGLPYLMLDYPRIFSKEQVLAIRIMFWWGNYFSVTLHAKGRFARNIYKVVESEPLHDNDLLLSLSGDEWNHDLDHQDYHYADSIKLKLWMNNTAGEGFIKLSKKVELMEWELAGREIYERYHQFLQMIETSCQYDEKGL
jgi:hypothetical protein